MKINNYILFFVLLFFSGCEKEINISLNKGNHQLVIDGNLSTVIGESYVKITKTLNIDEITEYPTISKALVTITDSMQSKTDTLTESTPGTYTKDSLKGIEGHIYKLLVKIGTDKYTSTSTIPYSIKLDTLIQTNKAGEKNMDLPGRADSLTTIQVLPIFTNLTRTDKYYQFIITKNRYVLNGIIARSDLGSKGYSIPYPLFIEAKKNDLITIDMQFVDKTVYDCLFGLGQNINQFSATPTNPSSNISNGVLGFFNAHSTQKKKMVIK